MRSGEAAREAPASGGASPYRAGVNAGPIHPDIVILDEAQRIKNWSTKTAQAIKRLQSRYAFVLTGTPIENRIDELYSIIDFLDPAVFGPLFRFNREFYELDERGRPKEYRNLELLQERISPLLLRRRKADVETELPGRTDRNFFIPLSPEQSVPYFEHETEVPERINPRLDCLTKNGRALTRTGHYPNAN
jgi:SNF2 family DNA or RNA helicase